MERFDLAVIGSGPGGYIAAIRGAQLGMKVVCIEKERPLGGTCLNVGCIPSKALLYSSELFDEVQRKGKEHGIEAEGFRCNLGQMMRRKEGVVKGLTEGIAYLFKKNKILRMEGEGRLLGTGQIEVAGQRVEATHIVLAMGSLPIQLPSLPFDEKKILSSTGALSLEAVPKHLMVVGAGIIGLELGSVYRRLGAQVTVVELLDHICPTFDKEVSKQLLEIFKKQGIAFHLSTSVAGAGRVGERLQVALQGAETTPYEVDALLVAVGRRPNSAGLEDVGIRLDEKRRVVVSSTFETNLPKVYAIGDLIDGPMLAHKASEEGVAVVEHIAGHGKPINYLAIPNIMYTSPEVASVGFSEEGARAANLELRIGRFPFMANPRARCSSKGEGFVKVIGEAKSDRLIGMHIVGPYASEMIGEGALAISSRTTLEELGHLAHAHPTYLETVKEAALNAHGKMLHL